MRSSRPPSPDPTVADMILDELAITAWQRRRATTDGDSRMVGMLSAHIDALLDQLLTVRSSPA